MTDDSFPLVPSCETTAFKNDKKTSSWSFDDLRSEDESNNSDDFFTELRKNVAKNVYLDEQMNIHDNLSNQFTERSTVRVDSSDLISRCKHFLPLLTDANQRLFSKMKSGENVRIELDSDQDDEKDERAIEMNLMFCPNVDLSSNSDNASEESDNEDQTRISMLQLNKNSPANIIEIQSINNTVDDNKSEKTDNT